jgi:septal ring factor EnvC (AmiA/AmiB activator)
MSRALAIACCIFTLLLTGAPFAYGQTDTPVDDQTRQKLEEWKKRVTTSLKAEQSVLRQLYTIEAEQRRQQQELSKINGTLGKIRSRVAKYEGKIDALRADNNQRQTRVKNTLRRLYKLGRGGLWRILLESKDLQSFLKRYRAIKAFLFEDLKIISNFQNRLRNLASAKADLADDIATLDRLKQSAIFRKEAVWLERNKRMILLDQIQRNKALAMRATRELEAQDAKLAATIRDMPKSAVFASVSPESLVLDFVGRKGYLNLPVGGMIVGRFGKQTSRNFGTVTKNNGIDITASLGSPVAVIADGTVRYVGDFLGYGLVVIVDHGDRYHSLYAHLSQFYVAKGDAIKERTVIGTVGKSGALTDSSLHFEIRHKGVAKDPLAWFDFEQAKEEE